MYIYIHTPTHTQKYINWKSNVPMVTKTGSFNFTAYDLCTEINDRNEELEFLKDTFIANDFPINIADRIFQKYVYIPHKYRTLLKKLDP